MRRRNRKRGQVHVFAVPVRFASLAVLAATLTMAYVWLRHCEQCIGKEIVQFDQQHEMLRKKYLSEEYKWACAKSPHGIEEALARHRIVMCRPDSRSQVVRLDATSSASGRYVQADGRVRALPTRRAGVPQ